MKKFLSYFFVSLLVIVCVFLLVSLTMSSVHGYDNVIDEWKSWLPEEEQEELVDTSDDVDIETEIVVDVVE